MARPLDIQAADRILVSRTDRLGDLILAIPFIETLKIRYPECRIDVLASDYAAPILENNPRIDNIVTVNREALQADAGYREKLAGELKRAEYKAVVALFPERRLSHLFKSIGIPIRMGTAGRFYSVLFNHRLYHSRKNNRKHEADYNLDFLKFFKDGQIIAEPQIYLNPEEKSKAAAILKNCGINKEFIVIHPGSGGSSERWPLENFIHLYKKLVPMGLATVITGSTDEGAIIDKIARMLKVSIIKMTGETDLRVLASVLSLASVVVANSTGPLHLAAATGTKVVGLYPSNPRMSPRRWGPLGNDNRVIIPTGRNDNMESISIERVAMEVISLFMSVTAVGKKLK